MSKYLKTKGCSNLAIAICPRCKFKIKYEDLVKDPNTQQMVCPECQDQLDPYRLPVRAGDKFNLQYPRPDEDLVVDAGA